MKVVYDIEVAINLFLFVGYDIDSNQYHIFEISSRKDDSNNLVKFLQGCELMIGFNNLNYDYHIVYQFLQCKVRKCNTAQILKALYNKSNSIIKGEITKRPKNPIIPQIDLFLINHYDNPSKSTSLKMLEFNLAVDNIQELPFSPGKYLTDNEVDEVIDYCRNDVDTTYKFYKLNIQSIQFRERMSKLYKHDFTNYNDVKIGERILLNAVATAMDKSIYDVSKMRTYRKKIAIKDIILDYISFTSKEFNIFLNWWKKKVITQTKGQFTEIPLEDVQEILPYMDRTLKKGKIKRLNLIYKGFQFDFGTGGIHGISHPGVFKSDEDNMIVLVDVSSYYPNLAAKNGFHPAHIPKDLFVSVIEELYKERMQAKENNDDEMVKAIKLALNGALYGKSNSEYSFMYDPQFMMSICINGQLLLAMLSEKILNAGMEIIQINTDGIMVRLKRSLFPVLKAFTKLWMSTTKLKLDFDYFKYVVQRDVNSYIAVYEDGKIKRKGTFDYEYEANGDYHKNFSMRIVAKALEAYYLKGIEPEDFIYNHKNMYDFFLRTKITGKSRLEGRVYNIDGELLSARKLQKITRYYASIKGELFVKIMPPLKGKTTEREFLVEAETNCVPVNKITDEVLEEMKNNINYQYYVNATRRIIEKIS